MSSPLRSFVQYAPLERKRRLLSEKAPDWKARIKALATPPLVEFEVTKARACYAADPDPSRLRDGLMLVTGNDTPVSAVGMDDLVRLHATLEPAASTLRSVPAPRILAGHEPLEAAAVPRALARFFEWTASDAFGEMHPVEQMSLCQVRLCEIWPFEAGSGVTADLFALLVLYRKTGLLPLFAPADIEVFREALSDAFRFVTKALVDLNRAGCERACDELLGQV